MRTIGIAVGALALAVLLLVLAFTTPSAGDMTRWTMTPVWTVPVPGVLMAAQVRGRAGTPGPLVAQGTDRVVVVDATGGVLADKAFVGGPMNTAMGDVNGDGEEDIVVAQGSTATTVSVFTATLRPLWSAPVAGLTQPARVLAVDLDGDGRSEVVVGDTQGRVAALTSSGRPSWSHAFPSAAENAEIRGLDGLAAGTNRGRLVAVARRSGEIALLDAAGKVASKLTVGNPVRRLRVFDVDGDGRDEAVIGDERGFYQAVAADGKQTALGAFADTITEIRTLESDGDAARREFVVAGKSGGFALVSGRIIQARGSVPGKVSAAGGVDSNGDGRDELFVGTEEGGLFMFDGRGEPLADMRSLGKVERVFGVESGLRDRLLVVGAGETLAAYRARRASAPAWYSPWVPAVLGLLAIGVGALALALTQRAPEAVAPVVDMRTNDVARSIARVEDLIARGVVTEEMGAERLRQLDRQRAKLGSRSRT